MPRFVVSTQCLFPMPRMATVHVVGDLQPISIWILEVDRSYVSMVDRATESEPYLGKMPLKKLEAIPIGPPGDAVTAGHRGRFATRDSSCIGSWMEQGELGITRADHNGFGSAPFTHD